MNTEAINRERFRKVWSLTSSPAAGEAAAARAMAEKMLAAAGLTMADVPGLLAEDQAPPEDDAGFTFYDMNNPAHVAAWQRKERQRRAESARRNAPFRAEVIRRYGSEAAAMAWTADELALRAAVRSWSTFHEQTHTRWTASIDGADRWTRLKDIPARVIRALSTAMPLPITVTAAKAEFESWERRDRDLQLIYEDDTNSQIDLPAYFRRDIVRALFETGLRAASLEEVLLRQRHLVGQRCSMPEMDEAVLADLEHLSRENVQSGRHEMRRERASDRRAAVREMLRDPELARLPDREIARRAGVSPSTVGNIRRRMDGQRQDDLFGAAA